MSSESSTTQTLVYPAPTIVVGVGRLGLAVLERLGEDWMWLNTSAGQDASLKNLRLIHVRADGDDQDRVWRQSERQAEEISRYIGEGDLPTLALDFVILRAMGLIRYHNGIYQVAIPRDMGVVEKGHAHRVLRRRYFEWRGLSSDPIEAVERLAIEGHRSPELDTFVTPIIHRVRHGHSPRLLLRCISRCKALAERRDPSPWQWFWEEWSQRPDEDEDAPDPGVPDGANTSAHTIAHTSAHTRIVPFDREWLTDDDRLRLIEGVAPEPLLGWTDWLFEADSGSDVPGPEVDTRALDIHVPDAFVPTAADLRAPLAPAKLLRIDWEATGWATEEIDHTQAIEFHPVELSMFRLGLFDHDNTSRLHAGRRAGQGDGGDESEYLEFRARLEALGELARRGLVRLWVDLQRVHAENHDEIALANTRQRNGTVEALAQSLEFLGELLVKPIIEAVPKEGSPTTPGGGNGGNGAARGDQWVDGAPLPERPSGFLRGLVVDRETVGASTQGDVRERLAQLGLPFGTGDRDARKLLREVSLQPSDIFVPAGAERATNGVTDFRTVINDEARHLFNFSLLAEYRQRPTRRPPRLTIYVVAEMSEPLARHATGMILRQIHAELLRAYGPIFETYREGFDRALSIVPIFWMPNPSDVFGGQFREENRHEEAAILDSVQGIRRWAETVPRKARCVSQLFVNSRVTNSAVLSVREAVSQTRDFIAFQIRNDISQDAWLRQTAVGPQGDDLFASFSCHEIDFPAERAREYLANRFGRECLARLREGNRQELAEISAEPFAPPTVKDLTSEADRRLREHTGSAADKLANSVEDRISVERERTSRELRHAFDEDFEEDLFRQVHDSWMALTRRRGNMDDMVDKLRRGTSEHLGSTLHRVRRHSDELVRDHAGQGGLKTTQRNFNELRALTRDQLQENELTKQKNEQLCVTHRIPDTRPIASSRSGVVDAARDKPDHKPMRLGLLVWALMAPALGAPLAHAAARAFELNLRPNLVEFLLGPLGFLVGAAVLVLPVWWLLRRHMQKAVDRVREAVRTLADAVRSVVEGRDSALFASSPSIRSFFAARLHLTAALAARNYATRVHEQVVQDTELAFRLTRSVEVQDGLLMRRAEDIGVRPAVSRDSQHRVHDDLKNLFSTRTGERSQRLIDPEFLEEYYRRYIADDRDLDAVTPRFLAAVGDFDKWRTRACLSETDRILDYGRDKFQAIVSTPVCQQTSFDEQVGLRLAEFVSRHYANVGFGARFGGYEGLDPNGVQLLAEASLVMHPAMNRVFQKMRREPGAPPTTETLEVIESPVLPNSAFMLSLVQGLRAGSVRNLRRFESFHDREEVTLAPHAAYAMPGRTESGAANPQASNPAVSQAMTSTGEQPEPGDG